ncbi:MAG: RepB family plasmid replication initiator protein [Rhizobiaceae bacterium]|nr:RepB family plasmid replication initiator protein [Rhizobiaceae bacterium]
MMFATKVRPPVRHDAKTEDGLFRPHKRGDIGEALAKKGALQIVAPESPRPAEMLADVEVREVEGQRLTADDAALHELLLSHAYAGDRSMPDVMHSFPVGDAVRYLGSRAEREDIWASLRRLKSTTVSYGAAGGRRYGNVSLLEWWSETVEDEDVIRYRLPAPLRDLLGSQPRYAYLELAALPSMSSKYSLRLYKRLALEASERKWAAGQDNTFRLSPTPSEFAGWVGYPLEADGTVRAGKLRERVLDKIDEDFAGVRAFGLTVTPRRGSGRGAPLVAIDLDVTLRAPDPRTVRCFFNPNTDPLRPGDKDIERFRIDSRTMRRAHKVFGSALRTIHARDYGDLWQIALNEAMSGEPLTDGYATRPTRGRSLLATVDSRGAPYAAWALFEQEAQDPDLRQISFDDRGRYLAAEKAAHEARYERLGDEAPRGVRKKAAPVIVDEEAGTPPPQPSRPVPEMTLEDCNAVVLTVDPACGNLEVDDIGTWAAKHTYTGDRHVDLLLRFGSHAHETWRVGRFPVSEEDIDAILRRFRTALDIEEYE